MSSTSGGSVMEVEDFLCGISRQGLCTIASRHNNNTPCSSDPTTCIPTFGTFNVVIPLHFSTGEKWIARIPRPGRMFTNPNPELLEGIMQSLVVTTQLVREETSIPVPEIHAWSSRDDNEAGCAYMLMDFVDGISLGDCLQDLSPEKTSNIVYEWAMYTWELTRLTFPSIGCLGVHPETHRIGVRNYISVGSVDQGRDNISPAYRGPYTSVSDYLFGISTLKKMAPHDHVSYDRYAFGTYLESLIPFAIKPEWNKGPFCLVHDDFNVQNIIVDPIKGKITGIIDWDYACIKPIQSLLSYPESLRWDLLAPVNSSFEQYQIHWSQTYRNQWADAIILASRKINTGCHVVNVKEILHDSLFFAELEKGLGESWRETEAIKFCSEIVYGETSGDVLKLAARRMRSGPWMKHQGNRAGYDFPLDLETHVPSSPPSPTMKTTKRLSIIGKVGVLRNSRAKKRSTSPQKRCEWREKFHQRKRVRKFLGRVSHDLSSDEENYLNGRIVVEKMEPLRKQARWWTIFERRFYGVRERTLQLE